MDKKAKKIKIALISIISIIVICLSFAAIYLNTYMHATEEAISVICDGEHVTVEKSDNSVAFVPDEVKAGLIFYQGAKVEYTAYAPLCKSLAEEGILCVMMKSPCNMAIMDIDEADSVFDKYPEIERWYVGGHSLGGAVASMYAAKNSEKLEGLVLLASFSIDDLTQSGLEIFSVYGSSDGVLNMKSYEENKANLPANYHEYVIKGGNHANFGNYGAQKGDNAATITPEQQQRETVDFLKQICQP